MFIDDILDLQYVINCFKSLTHKRFRRPSKMFTAVHPQPPYLVPESIDTLQAHDVVALEPGLFLPAVGGMRFERNYLITDCGHEMLTRHQLGLTPRADLPREIMGSPSR